MALEKFKVSIFYNIYRTINFDYYISMDTFINAPLYNKILSHNVYCFNENKLD